MEILVNVMVAMWGGILLLGLFFLIRLRTRTTCPKCHHRIKRCTCTLETGCTHPENDRAKACWTQDGWVEVCMKCGAWVYLGDDYDRDNVEGQRGGKR